MKNVPVDNDNDVATARSFVVIPPRPTNSDRVRNVAAVNIPYPAFYEAKEIAREHGMYQGSSSEFFPGTPGKEGTLFLFEDGPPVPLGTLTPMMVQILFGFKYTVDAQGAQ